MAKKYKYKCLLRSVNGSRTKYFNTLKEIKTYFKKNNTIYKIYIDKRINDVVYEYIGVLV